MSELPVTLAEAKLFLRVDYDAEDGLIEMLVAKARTKVEEAVDMTLAPTSPAPLRLAILMLALRAYERGDVKMPLTPVEAWLAPYRSEQLA